MEILAKILGSIISWVLVWAIVVGFIKLITLCFGLPFSFATATGVFLVLMLVCTFLSAAIKAGMKKSRK